MEYTHIIQKWPSQKQHVLFRASDGLRLGTYMQNTVIFGDDPNRGRSHVFVSEEKAQQFLRDLAQHDIDGTLPEVAKGRGVQTFCTKFPHESDGFGIHKVRKAVIEDKEMEGDVILAPGSIDMPNFHGVKKFN